MYATMTTAELAQAHRDNESAYKAGDRDMATFLANRKAIREALETAAK